MTLLQVQLFSVGIDCFTVRQITIVKIDVLVLRGHVEQSSVGKAISRVLTRILKVVIQGSLFLLKVGVPVKK